MQLLNPRRLTRPYRDATSPRIMADTVAFFEGRGHDRLREDYHHSRWYEEFLAHVKAQRLFAQILTPSGYGAKDSRWDTWRICEFAEILGFYGLQYWYTWQVSMLGLGPIWMSKNEPLKHHTAELLESGGIFAFGLSEKAHGADIYATEMSLRAQGSGTYVANGDKYYIGNGNKAALVSVFGRTAPGGDYVFFAARSNHAHYHCVRNVVQSQSYVAELRLQDYPVTDNDLIATGNDAWDTALNTVNIGKFNLGWAAIGICTHALYEAMRHATRRHLYKMAVTDFSHVRQLFVDATCRLMAMKAFATRACDYMRAASPQDRRYLLFNPMVKMKVTCEGEKVLNALWDVIAAKGFERDMYFQEAAVAIRGLPKLEGTVHVNIALILKFMAAYFTQPQDIAAMPRQDAARNDDFLFKQGPTRGLSAIRFHDYRAAFAGWNLPNVAIFAEQVEVLRQFLEKAAPTATQLQDTGFALGLGELFAHAIYGGLILEDARVDPVPSELLDQIFDVMVRDMTALAAQLHGHATTSDAQVSCCLNLVRRAATNATRFDRVWHDHVLPLAELYP